MLKVFNGGYEMRNKNTGKDEPYIQKTEMVIVDDVCGNCKHWKHETDCDYYGHDLRWGNCAKENEANKLVRFLGPHKCHLPELDLQENYNFSSEPLYKDSFEPGREIRYYSLKRDPQLC